MTIEDLRVQMGSCFTCGVSWTDDHVSLDCSECGGYSLERPCPLCEGSCGTTWKRDFTMVRSAIERSSSLYLRLTVSHCDFVLLSSLPLWCLLTVSRVWKCALDGMLPANERELDRGLVDAEQQLQPPRDAGECRCGGPDLRRGWPIGP